MTVLPPIADQRELDRRRNDASLWRPAIETIAERHGLDGDLRAEADGSAVVFGVGDRIVKLHAPWHPDLFATESYCIAALHGRLPVESPKLVATGDLEGWSYLVMTRLRGQPLNRVRYELDDDNLADIARDAGRLARAIQALPTPGFEPFKPWRSFLGDQLDRLGEHHRSYGFDADLVARLPAAIAGNDLDTDEVVLLHTELTDTNLMVAESDGRWRLTGVFDLEPAMLGHPLYDLPAIAMFVCRGEPALCAAAYDGFGVRPTERLRRQLLACAALHRYSRLDYFLELVGLLEPPPDWEVAARRLFGF